MYTRAFRYERADDLGAACAALRRHGEGAKVIAGGQSLLPMINVGLAAPDVVVDISRVAGRPATWGANPSSANASTLSRMVVPASAPAISAP